MDKQRTGLTPADRDLLKRTYAKGSTDDELNLFLAVSAHRGLDPFSGQICFVKQGQMVDGEWKMVGSFRVTIDGLRSLADRTCVYMPSDELPTFAYDKDGALESATVYVKKWHQPSQSWMRVPGMARYDEFVQMTGKGDDKRPNAVWAKQPHNMLAKCAESQAIRRAFPTQTEGLDVEVDGATVESINGEFTVQRIEAPTPATEEPTKQSMPAIPQTTNGIPLAEPQPAREAVPADRPGRMNMVLKLAKAQDVPPSGVQSYVRETLQRPNLPACTDEELLELIDYYAPSPAEAVTT